MKPKHYNHKPYAAPAQNKDEDTVTAKVNPPLTEESKEPVSDSAEKEEAPVSSEEVKEEVPTPAPAKEEPKKEEKKIPQIAAINVDLCNVRKAPSATADILGTAIKNAEFRVDTDKTGNGYVAINFGGIAGFIREDLVRVFANPAYVAHDVRTL